MMWRLQFGSITYRLCCVGQVIQHFQPQLQLLNNSIVQLKSHFRLFATHGLQHARLPCHSPSPRVCSNSCSSSQWCNPTISSSVIPFFSCLSQHRGLFQWVSSSQQLAKVLEFQLLHQAFQWLFRNDFLHDGLVGSPCSPRDSQDSFPTPQFKSINSSVLSFLSMNSMKRQKDRTLKDELPRLVGAQYTTGDQWRNNSRKN